MEGMEMPMDAASYNSMQDYSGQSGSMQANQQSIQQDAGY